MRLLQLTLKNIGPFDEADLTFADDPKAVPPVVLITGENGTGKTILIDAIRGLFSGPWNNYGSLERTLWREGVAFEARLRLQFSEQEVICESKTLVNDCFALGGPRSVSNLALAPERAANGECPDWVVDYWRSALATDSYKIQSLVGQDHGSFLKDSLQGTYRNAAVTELICHFDYLRDSNDAKEKRIGEALYEITRKIIRASLIDGELSHIARSTFTPMVRQGGQLVPLSNLSSGNAYLIQHFISMLGKMYAVAVLRDKDPAELCNTPGVVLIDEAENHLHPRWQKRFIPRILEVFPNLQIIATTHSPFILSSVPNVRVFVCRADGGHCVVREETDVYANKPVEEILLSPAFSETAPFNEDISGLMEQRKRAAEKGDDAERRRIEAVLKARNPDYFSYFDVEERLRSLGRPG